MDDDAVNRILTLLRSGQYEEALQASEEAERAAREAGNPRALARALDNKSDALRMLSRYEEALQASEQAEHAAREAGDPLTLAQVLASKSQALVAVGRYEQALQVGKQAAEAAQEAADNLTLAQALDSKSDALRMLDRYEEALQASDGAVEAAQEAGEDLALAHVLNTKSQALGMLKRHDEVLQVSEEAERAAREAGAPLTLAQVLDSKSRALGLLGRYEEALQASEEAEDAAIRANVPLTLAQVLNSKAQALGMLVRYEDALQASDQAAEAAEEAGDDLALAQALGTQAVALIAQGRYPDALGKVEVALNVPQIAGHLPAIRWLKGLESFAEARLPVRRILRDTEKRRNDFITQLGRDPTHLHAYPQSRIPEESDGALVLLRGWASYTTIPLARSNGSRGEVVNRVVGSRHLGAPGGYLLRWRERGFAIDPGIGFLEAMEAEGFVFRHIDEMLLTHYHVDHLGDLLQVLACAHELREAAMAKKVDVSYDLRFLASPSCDDVYKDLVEATTGHPPVRLSPLSKAQRTLGGTLTVVGTPAKHDDLLRKWSPGAPDTPAIGVHLRLFGANRRIVCRVGITGDTGWTEEVSKAFGGSKPVNLLVLHIGGLYPEDEQQDAYASNHLGFQGAKRLLQDVDAAHQRVGTKEWLAVVSEWGEELQKSREEICALLQEDLTCGKVIPGEYGVYIALPQCKPLCQVCRSEYATRRVTDAEGHICYVCDHHIHGGRSRPDRGRRRTERS